MKDRPKEKKGPEKVKRSRLERSSLNLELVPFDLEKLRRTSLIPQSVLLNSQDDSPECVDILRDMPLTEETTCGFWFFRGPFLQKFANKKAYVMIYGLMGCVMASTFAYFNGTITTLEKRFQIPSRTTGLISVAGDICQIFMSIVLSYYAGKGHKPRWIAFGNITMVLFCLMMALPHFIYGPGHDALKLTYEYGGESDPNVTFFVFEEQKKKTLCQSENVQGCAEGSASFYPQMILFLAQFVGGIGGCIYYSLGIAYMDDNVQKSKTPALMSFSMFLRMLGPAMGYTLASFCLQLYVSIHLTPSITVDDPRWLGAWWLGWIVMAILLALFGFLIALFPKTLPRAAARRMIALEKRQGYIPENPEIAPSFFDMLVTIKRLLKNKAYVCNNLASIFYCIGYTPYWIFMPKYIESQYRQSASISSFFTGTVGIVFSSIGIISSGLIVSKLKPPARTLASWNVIGGALTVLGMLCYMYLGCDASQTLGLNTETRLLNATASCNPNCNCEYVSYSPVCSSENVTYISPCHAGCTTSKTKDGQETYSNCSCASETAQYVDSLSHDPSSFKLGNATAGSCPIDCSTSFHLFLAVLCTLNLVGSATRSSEILISVRCIDEADKSAAMGFSIAILSLLAFVPPPIIFGHILDTTCTLWGKTCSGTGNCWLYDGQQLRYLINIIAAVLVGISVLFDAGVWYYVKDVKIFDN